MYNAWALGVLNQICFFCKKMTASRLYKKGKSLTAASNFILVSYILLCLTAGGLHGGLVPEVLSLAAERPDPKETILSTLNPQLIMPILAWYASGLKTRPQRFMLQQSIPSHERHLTFFEKNKQENSVVGSTNIKFVVCQQTLNS